MSSNKLLSQRITLNNTSILVRKESRTTALFIHTIAESMGMQFTDIRCLDFLMDVRSATAGKIAKIAGLTTGATTAMIDRLEKAKFVKRTADTKDRRKVIITFIANRSRCSNISNNFFTKNVPNLLSTYTTKERKIIADWNEKMTLLLQDEIKKLSAKKYKK